jgi:hypothetical protein
MRAKGYKHTEISKAKMSKIKSKFPTKYWSGKKFSEEHKRKIGIANKGKTKGQIHPWMKGKESHFWKGGISTYERKLYLNNRRRAKKKNAEGSHTFGEWVLLKKQYGYTCPCCGRKEPDIVLTEDHIIPLSQGGSDYIENIQPLCRSCNSSKYTKIIKYKIK